MHKIFANVLVVHLKKITLFDYTPPLYICAIGNECYCNCCQEQGAKSLGYPYYTGFDGTQFDVNCHLKKNETRISIRPGSSFLGKNWGENSKDQRSDHRGDWRGKKR